MLFSKQSSAAQQARGMVYFILFYCGGGGVGVLHCLSVAARGLSVVAGATLC